MSNVTLPPLPYQLKTLQHYLKTATEHDKRDCVVAYYCRLYALQSGLEIDKKSPECKAFHLALMDYMERAKRELSDEAIHNEVVGQAHMESYALKMFLYADNEDRAARFNKNVVKSFYTAGMLFDTLSVFGELSEDIEKNRKYAKWKAAYIHKCLKNGETPVPGPMGGEDDEFSDGAGGGASGGGPIGFEQPGSSQQGYSQPSSNQFGNSNLPTGPSPSGSTNSLTLPTEPPGLHAPPSTPQDPSNGTKPIPVAQTYTTDWTPPKNACGVALTPQQYQKAMKFCKYATSAMQYEDSKTAIDNLTKALTLLTTGKES